MRRPSSCLLGLTLALAAVPAGATKPARACIEAHASGQVDRDAGQLLQARERFALCAAEPCPGLIRKECEQLQQALASLVPSVVLLAQDGAGQPIAGGHATIDGNRIASVGQGTAIELDPGLHRFEILLPDGRRQAFDLTLQPSEQGRRVVATFASGTAQQRPEEPSNTLAYVLGGVGLLALGAWGAFAWDGRTKQAVLESCAPRCSNRSQVEAMRRSYLVADVMLGVSLVTLGTGAYLLIDNASADNPGAGRTVLLGAQGRF